MRTFDVLAGGLAVGYALTQLRFLKAWRATPETLAGRDYDPADWSVVIAARDEATGIRAAVASALPQAGEVVVVDDHSADATAAEARDAGATVLALPAGRTGKKAALALGATRARGDWVATLDADAVAPPRWLASLAATADRRRAVAVAGPVALAPADTWFARWQALDFCGMMAITAASLRRGRFAMGNGANLAFRRGAFRAVGGYAAEAGAREAASGDDVVLLGKLLARYPGRVAFAKTRDAVVATAPRPDVASFVWQRWRWAAKTGLNRQPSLTATLGLAWAFHVGLWAGFPLAAAGRLGAGTLAGAWLGKAVVDYALLRSATRFFGRPGLLDASYPLQSAAHAAYVAGVGTLALLPLDFSWKGRRHRA